MVNKPTTKSGDQVVHKCKSDSLHRKLLEKGKHLTFTKTLELAATFETVQQQFEAMKVRVDVKSVM